MPVGRLVNAAAICADGRVVGRYHKRLLPNYGVFDEQRWFAPGGDRRPATWWPGCRVGVTICEDMWFAGGPMADQAAAGARLLVNLNASPYSRGRRERAAGRAGRPGGGDRLRRSSTSTRSAARTSWSSTVPRWSSDADGAVRGLGRPVREEVLLVDVDVEAGEPGHGPGRWPGPGG